MSKSFTAADVAKHNKGDDLFIIVDEDVYDLTSFQDERKQAGGQTGAMMSLESILTIFFQILVARKVQLTVLVPYFLFVC